MTETRTTGGACLFVLRIGVLGFLIPSDFGFGISDFPHFTGNAGWFIAHF
jgi:hypothetical protein